MPGGRAGAVARATLSVGDTGVTARKTRCADARAAQPRAAVAVSSTRGAGIPATGSIDTAKTGGTGPAAATAAVIATHVARARADRRAAVVVDTGLARCTTNTGAARGVADFTYAGIAGAS